MHQTLTNISKQLKALIAQIQAVIPSDEPFGNIHNNWSFPGLTRSEIIEETQSIIDLIEEFGGDEVGSNLNRLHDYVRRLQHLQNQTVANMWGNAGAAVPAYLFTLQGLRKALAPVLKIDEYKDSHVKTTILLRKLNKLERDLNNIETRSGPLTTMLERIENAYNAADQLPSDLSSINENRKKLVDFLRNAENDHKEFLRIKDSLIEINLQLNQKDEHATTVLQKCETAYSAATSVGLAKAFIERSVSLEKSMWVWVCGLIIALILGFFLVQNNSIL